MISVLAGATGRLGGGQALEISVLRIVLTLLLCLFIAALAVLFLRSRASKINIVSLFRVGGIRNEVEIVEVRRMGTHADVGVLRHRGREYLVLLHASGTRVLRECELPLSNGET